MSVVEFVPYPKIPRLKRNIVITEKIDGTNACIIVPEDGGPLVCQSRNRIITPESDNCGFARWVKDNEAALKAELGYGRHFGEWWGAGIQRRYDQKEKHFSLFNTGRFHPEDLKLCRVVPILYTGPWLDSAFDAALNLLREKGSFAAPGFMSPEGIVTFHCASGQLFKTMLENDDTPKGLQEAA